LKEFIMGTNQPGQADNPAGGKSASRVTPPGHLDQGTWVGGGREPIHPDDIGDDGEYLGKDMQTQPRRSADSSDD